VDQHRLSTVCEEAHCPNIGECWSNGTATIMLMGSVCTRACRFCAVDTGNPRGWLDPEEPANTAESVELMGLRYIVLTSVDRDDLPDGGAGHYADSIRAIKARTPEVAVEALTPDFRGDLAGRGDGDRRRPGGLRPERRDRAPPHPRGARSPLRLPADPGRAGPRQALPARRAHQDQPDPGPGRDRRRDRRTMDDLRAIGCDILTLGQYLRPTRNHLPIERWVTPKEFEMYRQWGLDKGFLEVASGPMVRSSYRADRVLEKNNLGLAAGA
jgi:lipoyl synthase